MANKSWGFFSQKQFNRLAKIGDICANVYLTPEGDEVIVTEFTSKTDNKPGGNWDDYVSVGEVTKWVRHVYSSEIREGDN